MDRQQAIRYFNGLARGLGPDNLGAPVDAAAAALNLGLAGAGYVGHKTGLLKEPLPLIEKPVGGSDWIAEKLGNADDGSGAYTAGRLTPMALGLARAGGRGAVKGVDKLLTQGPAAHGKAAQRGAIRLSRGRGDNPQPDLVLSTSLNQELLPELMTKGGDLELYSPSFGVTRNRAMDAFGDLALIPKIGAFDPATSPSTLFNRDAYTARWGDFEGKIAKRALKRPEMPLAYMADSTTDAMRGALAGKFGPEHAITWQGRPLSDFPEIRDLQSRYSAVARELGPEQAWDRLVSLDTDYFPPENMRGMAMLSNAIHGLGGTDRAMISKAPDLRKAAESRLTDRLHLGVRPEDLRLNEGGVVGEVNPDVSDNFLHQLAVRTSPAFRSFQAYERSPLGAGLLRSGRARESEYQQEVLRRAFGDDFGWLSNEAKKELIRNVPAGPGDLRDSLDPGLPLSQVGRSYQANGFNLSDARGEAGELYKAAALARRGIQHTPSEYAELKVLGSVPVNADTFAGAMVQHGAMPETERILKYLGLPVIEKSRSWTPEQELEAITALQRGMAAPRQPAK